MAHAGLKWSQAELAKRLGVASATIARFEKNSRSSHPKTIRDFKAPFEKAGIGFEKSCVSINKDEEYG